MMLRKLLLLIFTMPAFFVGCLQTENSSSSDGVAVSGSEEFMVVNSILRSRCAACHDFHNKSEEQLKEEASELGDKFVLAGDPENSAIYYELIGSLGSKGDKDMPKGLSISSEEVEFIHDWIMGLQP